MIDETPKTVPDYNSQPAQPKFDLSKALVEIDGYYSAFWPLLIVFFAFIVLLVYEVSYLRYRKLALTEQLTHFTAPEKTAKEQAEFIQGMHDDLEALAPTHPDVAAIMKDFFSDNPATSNPVPDSTAAPQK